MKDNPGVTNIVQISIRAPRLVSVIACVCLLFGANASAGEKERYVSGDNYNATQFSAPGLRDSAGETIKMLIGRDVDAAHGGKSGGHKGSSGHKETSGHGSGENEHGEKVAAHGNTPYHQVQCGSFCRDISDDAINETYEACLGPCFKCGQVAIRAQSAHGGPDADTGAEAFEACWSRMPEMGAF